MDKTYTYLPSLCAGLLSLDIFGLEVVSKGGNPKAAVYAEKIIPVRKNGNLLLCTLLLGNVATNTLLSIVMAGLTNGLVGFLLSTTLITIFGEILPQAVCSRHALRIGAYAVPVVKVIMALLWPVCKPLSFVLDRMLGEEVGTIHSRMELRELLQLHVKYGALDVETGREIEGALHYKDIEVRAAMTPISKVYMLSAEDRLNFKTVSEIFRTGFSRIPVYGAGRDDIVGLVFTKDLIFIDPEDETPVKNFVQIFGRGVQVVWPDQRLGEVLKLFKQGRGHMAIVRDVNSSGPGDPYYEVRGIITLEDIIEEILGDEIIDETDAAEHVGGAERRAARQAFDATRLQLLNATARTESLSREEAGAVAAHLSANVEQFRGLSRGQVAAVVAAAPVVNLKRAAAAGAPPATEDVLYRCVRVYEC
ncbi:putative magnesium and cobalt efflux protein corC [Tribonema minus]|uniref:Putative magnesium and cobalt efflux protein corC n=1 Tax=Tribonema minus TaxID=303371 RepID=A0A836CN78_9STRA|nr:putative magnesium and cobalt efflux protein corC [Tribonema minus]